MSNFMEYKGYYSNPRYSAEDNVFWGKLDGISDSISFEGTTVSELQTAFAEAVEDYLDTCKRNGMTPKTPFHGRLEINIAPDIHRQVALFASERDVSLNQAVETALKGYFISSEY
jgi:predicted HicB family RNase H-like nuclease